MSNNYLKKQCSKTDYSHTSNHQKYRTTFASLVNKNILLGRAQDVLEKLFSGTIVKHMIYMKESPFHSRKSNISDVDGVVFLHDFFDSISHFLNRPFIDYYEWTYFTLKLIRELNLNFAVKPHPNQRLGSEQQIMRLKNEFYDIQWIDSSVSNKVLFKKIKYGISFHGSVLPELAYHNIVPIAAGSNFCEVYDFVFTARTKQEYRNLILNRKDLKLGKDTREQVKEFYYMHALHFKGAFPNSSARKVDLIGKFYESPNSCFLSNI